MMVFGYFIKIMTSWSLIGWRSLVLAAILYLIEILPDLIYKADNQNEGSLRFNSGKGSLAGAPGV